MVRGYHVYRNIWEAKNGEVLTCEREINNGYDPFAVSVIKDGVVVGNLPRMISTVASLFLKQKGSITCHANGKRRYSRNLPQRGLEIPCQLYFNSEKSLIDKIEKLLTASINHFQQASAFSSDIDDEVTKESAAKRQRCEDKGSENTGNSIWLVFNEWFMTSELRRADRLAYNIWAQTTKSTISISIWTVAHLQNITN